MRPAASASVHDHEPRDYNGDGYSDIALTGGAGWGSIPLALGTGNGFFALTNRGTNRFPRWASDGGATVFSGRVN